jgi:methylated-DNA-[protein]-cysteine S-methyltransferase
MTSNQVKYFSSFLIDDIHFTVVSSDSGLRKIIFNTKKNNYKSNDTIELEPGNPKMHNIYSQMKEYFNKERKEFNIPLEIEGTDFQKKVWDELVKIPFGTTVSYKELAVRLGDEKVIRAAASANGSNPLPIVIPCHRVIGSNGSLVGYGGGLKIKEKLLTIEGNRSPGLFD